ncbi:Crustacean calcium-binding protein 23 [Lamellibrachia satsuma]|nr:Crustacean calcium-binding protein 23 [Lamellibrachia satsuma]
MNDFIKEDDNTDESFEIISPFEKLREATLGKSVCGLKELGRVFRIFDANGNQRLNYKEFCSGLRNVGLKMTSVETRQMFSFVDRDHSGSVDFDEFIEAMRPPISPVRMALIDAAFKKLDSNNDGIITVADMKLIYNASADPNARSGKLTVEQALDAFLKQFDGGRPDGKVFPLFGAFHTVAWLILGIGETTEITTCGACRCRSGGGASVSRSGGGASVSRSRGDPSVTRSRGGASVSRSGGCASMFDWRPRSKNALTAPWLNALALAAGVGSGVLKGISSLWQAIKS